MTLPRVATTSQGAKGAVGVLDLWQEGEAVRLSPSAALGFMNRHRIWIAVASLAAAGAVFAATFVVFDKQAATATIVVDPRSANVAPGAGVLPNIGGDPIAIESIVQVTKSSTFLARVAQRLKLYAEGDVLARETVAEALGRKLTVARRGATYVIDVTASDASGAESARIANAAAQVVIDDQIAILSGVDEKITGELEQRLNEVQMRLSHAERAVADKKAELNITDVGQGTTLLERRVFELNQQRVLASAKAGEARARYEQLRRVRAEALETLDRGSQSPVLSALRVQRAALKRQAAEQATMLGPKHPALIAVTAQIGETDREIAGELARMQTQARTDMLEAEQQEGALAQQLKSAQQESDRLGPDLVRLRELERSAAAERTVYDQLLTRQKELTGTKDLKPSDIRLVSPATPPTRLKPPIPVRVALAGALGLLFGVGSALVRANWGGSQPSEAPETLAPAFVDRREPERGTVDPLSRPDDLLAAVTSKTRGRAVRAVLVCPSHRGAGARDVACDLARKLARKDALVLLIEAGRPQIRRPGQSIGLVDVLSEDEPLREAVIPGTDDGFAFLPFGGTYLGAGVSASALMRGPRLGRLLADCREAFDYVVIEGPAPRDAAYADALGRFADLAVIVASPGASESEVEATRESLDAREAIVFLDESEAGEDERDESVGATSRRRA